MLIAWLCCFLIGATLCPGAPDHSSISKHPGLVAGLQKAILRMMGLKTIPKKGPNDKVQQFMLDLYHQRVSGMETSGNTIRAFRSKGLLIEILCFAKGDVDRGVVDSGEGGGE